VWLHLLLLVLHQWPCGETPTAAADATAAIIATVADDNVDVDAPIAGLSLLQFNKCIRAL
jgi:hypothetical protein